MFAARSLAADPAIAVPAAAATTRRMMVVADSDAEKRVAAPHDAHLSHWADFARLRVHAAGPAHHPEATAKRPGD